MCFGLRNGLYGTCRCRKTEDGKGCGSYSGLYRKWEKQQQEFQILDEQVYEASAPLKKMRVR